MEIAHGGWVCGTGIAKRGVGVQYWDSEWCGTGIGEHTRERGEAEEVSERQYYPLL